MTDKTPVFVAESASVEIGWISPVFLGEYGISTISLALTPFPVHPAHPRTCRDGYTGFFPKVSDIGLPGC
jgi:hypothetical protein